MKGLILCLNIHHHPEPPPGYYRLNYGRAPMHTFSRTANNPNLTDLMDENSVWVNPKCCKNLGSDQWTVCMVEKPGWSGFFIFRLKFGSLKESDGIRFIWSMDLAIRRKNLPELMEKVPVILNWLHNVMIDPIMGGTGMRGNFVTFLTE